MRAAMKSPITIAAMTRKKAKKLPMTNLLEPAIGSMVSFDGFSDVAFMAISPSSWLDEREKARTMPVGLTYGQGLEMSFFHSDCAQDSVAEATKG
jgi:hypothetical protein